MALTVAGTLQVDGQLTANGMNIGSNGGGGAGGSLYLTVGTLTGAGTITANGGSGDVCGGGGGGAGGRIAITCGTNAFAGILTAQGGNGWNGNWGGAGTIYTVVSRTGLDWPAARG